MHHDSSSKSLCNNNNASMFVAVDSPLVAHFSNWLHLIFQSRPIIKEYTNATGIAKNMPTITLQAKKDEISVHTNHCQKTKRSR